MAVPTDEAAAWDAVNQFERWKQECHCLDENDSRCLPFPVFRAGEEARALDTDDGRRAFDRRYRAKGGGRADLHGLHWIKNPKAYHGYDQLQVAGRDLPRGFHWDAQNESGGPLRLTSPTEVWKVMNYVNIFPDGVIRGDRRHARKVL